MKPGLYIHIPFCLKKCGYCSFYSTTDPGLKDGFLSALLKEMELYREWGPFDTVYFGGGTPSLLRIAQLDKIANRIHALFTLSADAEWTIEVNPGDLSLPYCLALRQCGFNRINIGIQSLDDPVLELLGRRHDRKAALSAIECARAAGFENMGLDFIYGIPGQDRTACLGGLAELASFSPEHLSCYQLTIEEGTPMAEQYRAGLFTKPGEETEIDLFLSISEALSRAGYTHYEVSNYARGPERCSRHNMKYWDHTPYLGLGPSAHSFDGSRRWWNPRSIEEYCRILNTGRIPEAGFEALSREDLRLETLSLGLRTVRGISLENYRREYDRDLMAERKDLVERILDEGLILLEEGFLHPTPKGMAVADALARDLAF